MSDADAAAAAVAAGISKISISAHKLIHDDLLPKLQRPPELLLGFSKPNMVRSFRSILLEDVSAGHYSMPDTLQQTSWPKDRVILCAIATDIQGNESTRCCSSPFFILSIVEKENKIGCAFLVRITIFGNEIEKCGGA